MYIIINITVINFDLLLLFLWPVKKTSLCWFRLEIISCKIAVQFRAVLLHLWIISYWLYAFNTGTIIQEFREDLHDIAKQKSRDRDAVSEAGIMLRHINTDRYHKEFAVNYHHLSLLAPIFGLKTEVIFFPLCHVATYALHQQTHCQWIYTSQK